MGPYDNERGCYVSDRSWDSGQWLVDDDGRLYVIPRGGDEVHGPDEAVCGTMLAMLRDDDRDALDEGRIEAMGMTEVWDTFRRFSPHVGYHSA